MKKTSLYLFVLSAFTMGTLFSCEKNRTSIYPPCEEPITIIDFAVFELQYGEAKTIPFRGYFGFSDDNINEESYTFSITDINIINKKVDIEIKYGQVVDTINVSFERSWEYNSNGSDIQQMEDSLATWINEIDKCYIREKFISSFGYGNDFFRDSHYISRTLRIAKVHPNVQLLPVEQYKFIFIITCEN
ncbi:MAG: hypothetical protein LBG80_16195 [Bacteroidales bacterium]|jgi:hypothetical protein|nr:hypothetical protein [Bacteroidales bacterium]